MAGFDDVHMHLLSGARQLDDIDLSAARNPREIAVAIRACAAARPDEGWVVGRGWLYAAFPDGLPTRSRLDPLVPDRPALITAYDGHSAWANSRALEAAGVRHDTPDPPNGTILRDPASGEPSGALLEEAVLLVENRLPLPSREQDLAALRRAIAAVQLTGITSVQEAWSSTEDVPVWRDLVGRGELILRARLALPMKPEVDLPTWREQLLAFTAEVSGLAAGRWLWGESSTGSPRQTRRPPGRTRSARNGRRWHGPPARSHGPVAGSPSARIGPLSRSIRSLACRWRSTARPPDRQPPGGWIPAEAVSLPWALAAYTLGSAYAARAERWRGTIRAGLQADLVILDRDLLAEGPSAIVGTGVLATVIGGRVVHRAQ